MSQHYKRAQPPTPGFPLGFPSWSWHPSRASFPPSPPPPLSLSIESFSIPRIEQKIDFYLLSGKLSFLSFSIDLKGRKSPKQQKYLLRLGLPKEAVSYARSSLHHSHSDRSADRHRIPIETSRGSKKKTWGTKKIPSKRTTCSHLRPNPSLLPHRCLFLENT